MIDQLPEISQNVQMTLCFAGTLAGIVFGICALIGLAVEWNKPKRYWPQPRVDMADQPARGIIEEE